MRHKFLVDGGHLFLNCKYVKQRWQNLLLEDVRLKLLPCRTATEMLQEILCLHEAEKLLSVSLLWLWWQERNGGNNGENHSRMDRFQFNVRRYAEEWTRCLKKEKQTNINRQLNLSIKLRCLIPGRDKVWRLGYAWS